MFFSTLLVCAIDLEQLVHPAVVYSQKIEIKEFPYAFNPSIVRWREKLLLSFRFIPDPKKPYTSEIGLVWLNKDFKPVSKPQRLQLRAKNSKVPCRAEDGRLIVINDTLYLIYSDNTDTFLSRRGFRMHIAEILYEKNKFNAKSVERITTFYEDWENKREKNWVPFDYHGQLLLAYSIDPHRIMHPLGCAGLCEIFVESDKPIPWNWGQLRGGTQAILDGDHYLSFFHSSIPMCSKHSDHKEVMHYFIGAYTFSATPPFEVLSISTAPIVGSHWYNGKKYKPYWKEVQVVFPCGLLIEDDSLYITYGRQDHEMWIAKLDKQKLYDSLLPIS